MADPLAQPLTIVLPDRPPVSALWLRPRLAEACLVLAHGAGAGMTHPSVAALAEGLAERRIATLRFQFPYMERGAFDVDPPHVAHGAIRGAVAEASRWADGLPLFAGGRSFGSRMTSQAQAESPLPKVRGLVLFAFPLHQAGKPGSKRADHLAHVGIPMLFVQGAKDALARLDLFRPIVDGLGDRATLILDRDADHSFAIARSTGRRSSDVLPGLLDEAADWMKGGRKP